MKSYLNHTITIDKIFNEMISMFHKLRFDDKFCIGLNQKLVTYLVKSLNGIELYCLLCDSLFTSIIQ